MSRVVPKALPPFQFPLYSQFKLINSNNMSSKTQAADDLRNKLVEELPSNLAYTRKDKNQEDFTFISTREQERPSLYLNKDKLDSPGVSAEIHNKPVVGVKVRGILGV